MRKVLSLLVCLVVGFILFSSIAISQSETLRALPIAAAGLPQAVMATPTDQADLQRAGYMLAEEASTGLVVKAARPRKRGLVRPRVTTTERAIALVQRRPPMGASFFWRGMALRQAVSQNESPRGSESSTLLYEAGSCPI
jgi:hypothetical protein